MGYRRIEGLRHITSVCCSRGKQEGRALRPRNASWTRSGRILSEEEAEAVVDYLCRVADRREIYFLWRPFLWDPSDEMVFEVAVGAEAQCIVKRNVRDFAGVEKQFGVRVVRPGAFLAVLSRVADVSPDSEDALPPGLGE